MLAAVVEDYGPPEAIHIRDQVDPSPGVGEMTIDVHYSGVGFVDTLFRKGYFSLLSVPFTPGIEVSGSVRELGSGVTGFHPGQRVAALLNDFGRGSRAGGYAEIAVARADLVIPLPDDTDLATAAGFLVNGTTAWMALHDIAHITRGQSVAVLGAAGGIGAVACRIARHSGAERVIGAVGDRQKIPAAMANGCDDVITTADVGSRLRDLAGGSGPDIVFDPVGGQARQAAFDSLAPFGRLVVVGNASGRDETISTDGLWHQTRAAGGFSLGGIAHLESERVCGAARTVLELARTGVLGPAPHVRRFEEAVLVHRDLEARRIKGKVVLALRR